ncbi:Asp-tRNA(Asn)/Glu-tRNA(Gln) amidotransferase GatCAB subunit C [Halorubrum sp. 48-1-W]|uniref:Asp-tRNA(Asn)/Glu-tRNA(Gln) amidotransferase subunit GatC n=1 Tax=Halorubrum sp. 48-1-W TaxID=2249761 RepID=UPI000DCC8C2D|nr:Asp-tRNA(Asn)/Glu-tRNA(Gln) amidotransferase subunit GatC [Halorubrum sp. 48-1-W]RAW44663.1 Asp-tRNA(Asn)/Glu-tRNA(Gln) amidotransferase GatCAB subunit C [Halorubrum sp. 48-1-W]
MTDSSDPDGDPDAGDGDGSADPAVDVAEVEHVAELARVRLAEGETAAFADQFAEILEYFEALDEVPDLDREEELVNVMRDDEVEEGLTQEEALSNAAETTDGFFTGPKVS